MMLARRPAVTGVGGACGSGVPRQSEESRRRDDRGRFDPEGPGSQPDGAATMPAKCVELLGVPAPFRPDHDGDPARSAGAESRRGRSTGIEDETVPRRRQEVGELHPAVRTGHLGAASAVALLHRGYGNPPPPAEGGVARLPRCPRRRQEADGHDPDLGRLLDQPSRPFRARHPDQELDAQLRLVARRRLRQLDDGHPPVDLGQLTPPRSTRAVDHAEAIPQGQTPGPQQVAVRGPFQSYGTALERLQRSEMGDEFQIALTAGPVSADVIRSRSRLRRALRSEEECHPIVFDLLREHLVTELPEAISERPALVC